MYHPKKAFMGIKDPKFHVLMFPWLAHGHISPYLQLAKKLSHRNFHISFCSTPVNLSSLKKQLDDQTFPSIQLVELHLPSLPNLPPHYHTTTSLPPHLMSTLKEAFDMSEPSFSNILRDLKPDLLIYDYIQPWAPAAASRENIPAVHFLTNGAAVCSYLYDMSQNTKNNFPFPSFYLHEDEYQKIEVMFNSDSNMERVLRAFHASSNIILIKTCLEMEAKYLGYSSLRVGKEFVPVGPLIEEPKSADDDDFFSWLSKKEKSSVVFVSFGTEYFLSKGEIEEIAYGLELSEVNFIWVIRFPRGEKVEVDDVLPEGFLKRVGERGMVVRDWAPQANILAHSNVGGFVSHCGWSSVMEGIYCGVPIIAVPMQIDQPINAGMVVELGVGKEVERCNGKLMRGEVAKVIKEVVVEKEGEEVRRKAKELGEKMRKKGEDDIGAVVDKLVQVCAMSKKNQVYV